MIENFDSAPVELAVTFGMLYFSELLISEL